MRYLITGGSGFIGTHLSRRLLADGHQVTTLDPHPSNVRGVFHIYGSATNAQLLEALIPRHDGVFHLAATVGFANVMTHLVETIHCTTASAEAVFSLCARFRTRVVFTSTSAVYGRGNGAPARESDDALVGPSPTQSWSYAYAKAAAEALAFAYHRESHLPVIVTRLFNTVGPGQSAGAGFVLPRFCQQALQDRPLTVYAPGTQSRTFAAVGDVVRALHRLMETDAAVGELVNVGGTATTTMRDLAEMVIERSGSRSVVALCPSPYGEGYDDIESRQPALEKLWGLIGPQPVAGLSEIVDLTLESLASRIAA